MWPVLANINGIKITIFGLSLACAFFLASFLLWKKMRMDYGDDEILTLTIVIALLALLASLGWKWLSLGGLLMVPYFGLWLWCKKMAWNFWEWIDAAGPIGLIVGIVACLAWGPVNAISALVLLVGLVINLYFASNYRKFHWYKNGKTGFVGVTSIMWWMITWFGIANWHVSRVYWAGLSLESWIAIWIIVGSIITLYIRGGRRVTQDWRNFTKLWQAKKAK